MERAMNVAARAVIVTGGAQGIGRGLAERFLAEGCRVLIADCDAEAGAETAGELSGRGEIRFVCTDVADEASVQAMAEAALSAFGGIDVLVNNAGIMLRKPLVELALPEWNRVLAVNLTGAFLCAKHCAPALRRSRGTIVNIASTRAVMSEPDTESYSASKGGLVALTHALAVSLAPEVRVNCISPGWIDVSSLQKSSRRQAEVLSEADHAQHPVGRVGGVEDIAAMAVFLASAESGFVTGQNFVVDGGMTKKMIYV